VILWDSPEISKPHPAQMLPITSGLSSFFGLMGWLCFRDDCYNFSPQAR
jgi:hypothetical protein